MELWVRNITIIEKQYAHDYRFVSAVLPPLVGDTEWPTIGDKRDRRRKYETAPEYCTYLQCLGVTARMTDITHESLTIYMECLHWTHPADPASRRRRTTRTALAFGEFVVLWVVFYTGNFVVANAVVYTLLTVMAVWAHLKTMLTEPGVVPRVAMPLREEDEEAAANHTLCGRCESYKPTRWALRRVVGAPGVCRSVLVGFCSRFIISAGDGAVSCSMI